jgi:hypothetical protein
VLVEGLATPRIEDRQIEVNRCTLPRMPPLHSQTLARAIDVGILGGNLEDQMKPLTESVRAVEAAAGTAAGVPFVLNARDDAFLE